MIILRIIEWHLQPIPDGDLGPRFNLCAYSELPACSTARKNVKDFIFKNVIFDENSVFWRISYQMMLSSYKCNTSLICKFSRKKHQILASNFFNFIYALDYVQTGPKSYSSYSGYKPSHWRKSCLVLKSSLKFQFCRDFSLCLGHFWLIGIQCEICIEPNNKKL